MKKYLIISLFIAALSLAFFSCGSSEDPPPPLPPEGFIEHELELTTKSVKIGSDPAADKPVLEGESLELVKSMTVAGSYLQVTYNSPVAYACGEIGVLDETAGPVIHGAKANSKQTVKVLVEDIIQFINEDDAGDYFVFNMYNGGNLLEVILFEAPEGYVDPPFPHATAGATRIVVPLGGNPPGKGDISKADYKKIMEADDAANLVIYTASEKAAGWGVLQFSVKHGPSYTTTKVTGEDLKIDEDKKIELNIKAIKDTAAAVSGKVHGLDINAFDDAKELLYIEIVP